MLEQRLYSCEVRANTDNKIVGTPIVYDTKTDLGFCAEIIQRGALDSTDLKDVRFLVNHNTDGIPLARSRRNNGNSTMMLKLTEKGLEIEVDLDTENNSEARALYSAVKRGDISGMSFMFSIDDYEWLDAESDYPTRVIKKIGTVVEVSAVTFPAYEATSIDVRSSEALENAKRELDNLREERTKALENAKNLELMKLKLKLKYGG